ncbi:hypothetical protein C8F04DRAFT_1129525 [Mycena alexandri]|uniref:F-box domain-containing protein n=1 Tax=Mycena alexandri TaxID=1745969 RepID=A0AAD6SGU6_9AGAR|nr:hypothetical protein C8F04DRAFT_1129525 [Mycena alexandri]
MAEDAQISGPNVNAGLTAEIFCIPGNWHENWDTLRTTLQELEDRGLDPYSAIIAVRLVGVGPTVLDTSSVEHLKIRLATNYLPTAIEHKQVKEFSVNAAVAISKASARVQEDRRCLVESETGHSALCDILDPYLALLSPIRTLPPEILQEIFTACMPTRHDAVMHSSQMPLVLGTVCRMWRSLSLSTPALWSSIHVVVPAADDVASALVRERCDALRLWLNRSGDCPLFISVFVPFGFEQNVRPFVDVIVPYSHRWKSLKLLPATREDLPAMWNLTPEDIPILEVLEISDQQSESGPNPNWLRFFTIPPNLRRIALTCFNAEAPLPSCPWNHITSLCLESRRSFFQLDALQLVQLLAQCQNLETCRLVFPIGDAQAFPPPLVSLPQITLLHLETLAITADILVNSTFNIGQLMATLIVPALRELNLTPISYHIYNPDITEAPAVSDMILAMDDLLLRSSCDLREISIQFNTGDADTLLQSLRRSPNLTTLSLSYLLTMNNPIDLMPVLVELTRTESFTGLCPNLTDLRLMQCDQRTEFHPVLKALIESRCGPSPAGFVRLRNVHLALWIHSTLDTDELAARIAPCKASIINPRDYSSPVDNAAAGILDTDRDI